MSCDQRTCHSVVTQPSSEGLGLQSIMVRKSKQKHPEAAGHTEEAEQ